MAVVHVLDRATTIVHVDAHELWRKSPENGLGLTSFIVSRDPKIAVIPHFFTDAECDHLLDLAEGAWKPSRVTALKALSQEHKVSEGRTSSSCQTRYSQTNVVEGLEHRLADLADLPVSQLQKLSVVRYAPGERFEEHHDGGDRPKTVLVYLNDLSEDDTGGDTFFPILGLSFKPRRGTAILWANTTPEGEVDSRMLHQGQPPTKSVKYALNCFFSDENVRLFMPITPDFGINDAVLTDVTNLPPCQGHLYNENPRMQAVPSFINQNQVAQLLEEMYSTGKQEKCLANDAYPGSSRVLHVLTMGGTQTVREVESCMCSVSHLGVDHLSQLRIVQPGTTHGLCDRGFGCIAFYICLSERDDVFFPVLGRRVLLQSGDALIWPNAKSIQNQAHEDMRTIRVHLGDSSVIGLEASFHGELVRPFLNPFQDDRQCNQGGFPLQAQS